VRRPQPRQIIPGGDGGGASADLLGAEELAGAEVAGEGPALAGLVDLGERGAFGIEGAQEAGLGSGG